MHRAQIAQICRLPTYPSWMKILLGRPTGHGAANITRNFPMPWWRYARLVCPSVCPSEHSNTTPFQLWLTPDTCSEKLNTETHDPPRKLGKMMCLLVKCMLQLKSLHSRTRCMTILRFGNFSSFSSPYQDIYQCGVYFFRPKGQNNNEQGFKKSIYRICTM